MLDPIMSAVEVWLAIYNNLPRPIVGLMNLSLLLLFIYVVFKAVYTIRG